MKPLIVYYSLEGSTRALATAMAGAMDADLQELRPLQPESRGMVGKYVWGGSATLLRSMPELHLLTCDIASYQLIVLGSPVWAFTMTPPVRSFLSRTDLRGKEVALFITHRSGPGFALRNMTAMAEAAGATVLGTADFFDLRLRDAEKSRAAALEWLATITHTHRKRQSGPDALSATAGRQGAAAKEET